MNYEESESSLACAINHLGKRKGVSSFQWAETVAHEGKTSGWWVAYLSPRIKSDLGKKKICDSSSIHLWLLKSFILCGTKYITCWNILDFKNYLLLFIFPIQSEHEADLQVYSMGTGYSASERTFQK